MKITILVDNTTLTDHYFYGEPGLSFHIEEGGRKILFDLGYSDVFLKNALKMNIDLLDLDNIVLSHGHIDHTGGLFTLMQAYLEARLEGIPHKNPVLVAHPFCFYPKPAGKVPDTGSFIRENTAGRYFPLKLSREPVWLTEKLVFLGEIERTQDFEPAEKNKNRRIIAPGGEQPDDLLDDSALVYRSDEGLVIITGCAHTGICNTIEYARKVCGDERILEIVGGLHLLLPEAEVIEKTCRYLMDVHPAAIHPCHCTDLHSKIALSRVAPIHEAGVGLTLEYH
ncbi:MAG TPA: MBL fold metallo-hydrolase [Methanoregulaceae archaeon]|nr:MBL fold metallo-hydrolase [Methanoregulaceae archaeon]